MSFQLWQRFELLKAGHGADSKTLLYENITEALTELEPDSTWMLAHDEDGKVMVVATDDAEKSFYQLQDPIANMTCSRWCQSWWKWWAKSLQSSGICPDAHLRKAAPTKRTLEFAGGDDDAGVDFRTFQEATWSTYALVHMLVRFSTPSRGSSEKSARVQQIWNRWLGALIVRFFGTTTLDFVIMVDLNCDARPGLPAQGINPTRLRVTNGNVHLSPIALADIASVSPTSVELRRFGDCCTAMPMGVALREVHRQGRTSLCLYK